MNAEDREAATAVLRRACVGRQICGIHFYAFPILILDSGGNNADKSIGDNELFLRIESGWTFIDSGRPTEEANHPERPLEELAAVAARLRSFPIRSVQLGATADLTLEFEGGAALVLAGYDPQYESWELSGDGTMVVALPGGEVTF